MSESLNRLALVSRFSSHHLLGKLLPQPHELQEVVNNISNDTFARSTKKLTVDSSRLSKKHPKFSKDLESFLDSRQPETLGLEEVDGVSADERNALQTWNTIVDELLAFLCKLVEVTSSVYPSCWMVRLTMFEFLLVHYATTRLTTPEKMILDHVDALLSRIPDQGVSRNIEKLIEQESLLSFLFLLRVCTVATSTKVIVGQQEQARQALLRGAQANSNRNRVIPSLSSFLQIHQNKPCTLLSWLAVQKLLGDLPLHLHSHLFVLWHPSPPAHSSHMKCLMKKGIMIFTGRGTKEVAATVIETVEGIIMRKWREESDKDTESDGVISGENGSTNKRILEDNSEDKANHKRNRTAMSTISSDPSPLRSCPPNKPNFHSSSFQPPPASTGASNPPSTFVTPYSTLTSVLTPTPNSIPTSIPTPNHTHRALVNLSPTSDPIPETNPRHLPTSLPTQPQTPAFTLLSLPTVPSAIREHFLQTRFLIAISAIPLLHFKSNVYERDRLMRCLTVIVRSTHEVTAEFIQSLSAQHHTNTAWIAMWTSNAAFYLKRDRDALEKFLQGSQMVNSLDPFSSLLARYAEIYRQYEIELPKCCISHSPLSPQPGEKLMYPLITSPSHPSSNPTLPPVPAQAASRSTPAHNNIVLNSTGFQSMPTSFNPTPPIFTQTFIPTSAPTPASSSTRNPHSISKATPNLTVISTANPSQSTVMNPPPKPLPNPNSVLPRHPFHVTLLPTPSSPNSLPLPVSSITLPTTKDPNSTNPAPLVPSPSAAIPIPNPIPTPTYASITASIATPNPTTIPQAQPSPPVSTTQVPPPSPAIRWRVTCPYPSFRANTMSNSFFECGEGGNIYSPSLLPRATTHTQRHTHVLCDLSPECNMDFHLQ